MKLLSEVVLDAQKEELLSALEHEAAVLRIDVRSM